MKTFNKVLTKPYFIIFAAVYFVIYFAIAINNIPFFDTLYYWEWGRHLSISYYDGPPLIAYLFYLNTKLFGSSQFAINLFAIITNLSLAALIYYLAKSLFTKRTAVIACLIWLTTQYIFIRYVVMATYDTALALCWLSTVILLYKASQTHKPIYIYLTGLMAGMTLLAKYQGVLLWVAIFLLVIFNKFYRPLLRNQHTYFAVLLALLTFSPVIIWNWQHHFVSFQFQLNHGFHHTFHFSNIGIYFFSNLKAYAVFFILFLLYSMIFLRQAISNQKLALLFYPAWTIFLFFLACSPYNYSNNWNQAYFLTAVIFIAYYIDRHAISQWITLVAIAVGTILIANLTIDKSFPLIGASNFYTDKKALQQINSLQLKNIPWFTDDYIDAARVAFFLKQQPFVYTPEKGGEYQYWSKPILEDIRKNTITEAYYVISANDSSAMLKLFKNCALQKPLAAGIKKFNGTVKHSDYFLFYCHA